MLSNSESKEQSVLDEIRNTIASLDALRTRIPSRGATAAPGAAAGTVVRAAASASTLPPARIAAPASESVSDSDKTDGSVSFPVEPTGESSAAVSENIGPTEKNSSAAVVSTQTSSVKAPAARPVITGFDDDDDDDSGEFLSRAATCRSIARQVNKTAKIMIVDDEPLNIMTFRQHLKMEGYENFVSVTEAAETLATIKQELPDVLLLDIRMPRISGLDILRVMGLDPVLQHIPVLILTAATDPKIRKTALDLGASDFLSKPVDPNELLPRVRNALILKKHFDMVSNEAARLEQQVERRTRQLEATRQQLILSLARAAEHRDNDTGNHVIRVGRYAAIIAEALGYPRRKLSMLEQAAQLHDVGKIGIPDSILFKPGKLDWDQYELMKRHCAIGKQIIEPISEKDWEVLKTHTRRGESLLHVRSSPLLMLAARIAQTHHEKFDGSGYPLGLAGNDIPLEGRIVAVADVFDALSSARPYKKAFSRQKCFEILEEGRGKHFDPQILDAFFEQAERIIETQLLLMDEEEKFVGPDYIEELAEESPEDE